MPRPQLQFLIHLWLLSVLIGVRSREDLRRVYGDDGLTTSGLDELISNEETRRKRDLPAVGSSKVHFGSIHIERPSRRVKALARH